MSDETVASPAEEDDNLLPAEVEGAEDDAETRRRRRNRIFLVALLLLLLLLLCGMAYLLNKVIGLPENKRAAGGSTGVEVVFAAYALGPGYSEPLEDPLDVAYDAERKRIYVSDAKKSRLLVFDSRGRNGRVFVARDPKKKVKSVAEQPIVQPLGLAVGDDGTLYVCDSVKAAVVAFSPEGEKLREIRMMHPRYVAFYKNRLYVVTKGTLIVTDTQGNEIARFGTYGRGTDQLAYAGGVTVMADGTVLIADTNNYRILALDKDLKRLWAYGKSATTAAEQNVRDLASPTGIAVNDKGVVFVVDSLNSHIRPFTSNGKPLGEPLGKYGELEDEFKYPLGLKWMGNGLFVMADRFHDRIVGMRLTPTEASK